MAQGYQVPVPQRLWTADGDVAVGWKLTTYVAGTSTPLTTYSNPTLLSTNTNPIVTDGDGFFNCYVAAGVLIKLAVTDENDVPQTGYSVDNLLPMVDPTIPDPSVTAVPTGGVIMYGAATAPTGFLLCDGSIVSRTTYATLFGVIGTTYGAGNGSTTFGLPNMVGRFPLGVASSGTGSTLGGTGGSIDHTHTGPSHTHTTACPRDGWGSATTNPNVEGRMLTGLGAGGANDQAENDVTVTSSASGTGSTGTANPAFQTFSFIIKT